MILKESLFINFFKGFPTYREFLVGFRKFFDNPFENLFDITEHKAFAIDFHFVAMLCDLLVDCL